MQQNHILQPGWKRPMGDRRASPRAFCFGDLLGRVVGKRLVFQPEERIRNGRRSRFFIMGALVLEDHSHFSDCLVEGFLGPEEQIPEPVQVAASKPVFSRFAEEERVVPLEVLQGFFCQFFQLFCFCRLFLAPTIAVELVEVAQCDNLD